MKPTFFKTSAEFRQWLEKNHDKEMELWVGFYKTSTGKPSLTYPEAVDEALAFGWIDGIRKSIDAESYTNRFTPRKPTSIWSHINIKRVEELTQQGRMHPAGLKKFAERDLKRSGLYSSEQKKEPKLEPAHEKKLKANKQAWAYFQAQPPWYQKAAIWWVNSAKQEETRLRRLTKLIEDSAEGRTIPPLTRNARPK